MLVNHTIYLMAEKKYAWLTTKLVWYFSNEPCQKDTFTLIASSKIVADDLLLF